MDDSDATPLVSAGEARGGFAYRHRIALAVGLGAVLLVAALTTSAVLLVKDPLYRAPATLFRNASCVTFVGPMHNATARRFDAFLVDQSGRIVAVGEAAVARAGDAAIVDLQGATVLPAFTDAHAHLLSLGTSFLQPSFTGATNMSAIRSAIESWLSAHPTVRPGDWVLGGRWSFQVRASGGCAPH